MSQQVCRDYVEGWVPFGDVADVAGGVALATDVDTTTHLVSHMKRTEIDRRRLVFNKCHSTGYKSSVKIPVHVC